jgi:hypothetical protein
VPLGEQVAVSFSLRNVGVPLTDVTLLSSSLPWVGLLSPASGRVASLATQESTVITLLLSPGNATALGLYTGSVGVASSSPTYAQFIPFAFRVLSNAFGYASGTPPAC